MTETGGRATTTTACDDYTLVCDAWAGRVKGCDIASSMISAPTLPAARRAS